MAVDKACPVLIRRRATLEILAFAHPLAGLQLVKGSVEPGESSAAAAVRELLEEAGIHGTVTADLGEWYSTATGHTWAFHQCEVGYKLPDAWRHFAADDGGHQFSFFGIHFRARHRLLGIRCLRRRWLLLSAGWLRAIDRLMTSPVSTSVMTSLDSVAIGYA
jgi:8-oxo-dGTP pyrophosphatase MutT (NUDIX family)